MLACLIDGFQSVGSPPAVWCGLIIPTNTALPTLLALLFAQKKRNRTVVSKILGTQRVSGLQQGHLLEHRQVQQTHKDTIALFERKSSIDVDAAPLWSVHCIASIAREWTLTKTSTRALQSCCHTSGGSTLPQKCLYTLIIIPLVYPYYTLVSRGPLPAVV